jgi:hypothetical protein
VGDVPRRGGGSRGFDAIAVEQQKVAPHHSAARSSTRMPSGSDEVNTLP